MFSSLVTRLTLATLAVLVLSLALTTAVFVAQVRSDDRAAAVHTLMRDKQAVHGQVVRSLLNAATQRPLALMRPSALGIDRVLLTSWPDDQVVGDTSSSGGPPDPRTVHHMPISYHGRLEASGKTTLGGVDYEYLAVPLTLPVLFEAAAPSAPAYRNVIMLKQVTPLPARVWSALTRLALAGAIAVVVSSLAALVALRTITRPLHAMTLASERMAAGDYDQQVAGVEGADEVGQLARSFNRMAYEVRRVREMQRQFIANVSHDLRSPLTSIIGFSQVLTEDAAIAPAQRRTAEIIHSEAQRLYRLTMDLLDLSRLEAGRLPLSKRPLDLNATLHEVAARYQALPNKRGVRFAESLRAEPLPVVGDPDRLTQVVVNLLDNALKFCNPGGDVRLTSARQGGSAVIEVYNSGAGIAPEDLPHIFDRFYRSDHPRAQQTGGSGIGLAIVRELVHVHGGAVTAASEPGHGTTMAVRLPLASAAPFTKGLQVANTDATERYV
jgi:signal transduction histidine kinase